MNKKHLTLFLSFLVVLSGFTASNLLADDPLIGKWNGTLQAGGASLRLVFTFTKSEEGLSATLTSVDQGNQDIAFDTVSIEGNKVTLSIAAIGAGYSGELDKEKTTLKGTFSQSGMDFPLVMKKQ